MSTDRLPRAKRDYAPWSGAILRSALRSKIGQELKARYQPPHDLPHRLLALLIQLEPRSAEKSGSKKDRRCRKKRRGGAAHSRRSGTLQSEPR